MARSPLSIYSNWCNPKGRFWGGGLAYIYIYSPYRWYMLVYISGTLPRVANFSLRYVLRTSSNFTLEILALQDALLEHFGLKMFHVRCVFFMFFHSQDSVNSHKSILSSKKSFRFLVAQDNVWGKNKRSGF